MIDSVLARSASSLIACLAVACLSLSAAENASIPYENLDKLWQISSSVNQTNLTFRGLIASTNSEVHSTNIQLTIHSKVRGDIPVELNTNGELKNFVHTKELAKENPPVLSNQPKGTLSLIVMLQIPLPDGVSFPYAKLRNGVAEMNKLIKSQAGMLSLFAPKSKGVVLWFPRSSGGKARVEILSAKGKKEYTADQNGEVKFDLDSKLPDETEVRVSEQPKGIVPNVE